MSPRSKNAQLMLENMRAKYAPSSFPSQMTRLKDQWFQFGERHQDFDQEFQAGLRTLKAQRIASAHLSKYLEFGPTLFGTCKVTSMESLVTSMEVNGPNSF